MLPSPDSPRPEPVLYVRADRSAWDWRNLVSAPFAELVQFRELVRNIVSRDLKVRYKRSVLGVLWTVIAPLFSMLVMWAVFTYAMRVQIPHYAAYLLSGIIVWNFFLQSSTAGAASILGAAALVRKVRLPRVIFPVAAVVNNLVNLGFAFIAFIIVALISRAPLHPTLLLVPVAILPLVIFATGWAMMVSALSVFFRDVQYLLEIGLGALFYLTPIIYEPKHLPEQVSWIVSVNPIAKYIFLFRKVVYYGELPPLRVYLVATLIALVMFAVGWIVFQRAQRRFLYWL